MEALFMNWMLQPEVWAIIGLLLVGLAIVTGLQLLVLAPGVAAFIVALLSALQGSSMVAEGFFFSTWQGVLVWWAVLSIVAVLALLWAFQRDKGNRPDINEY